MADYVFNIAKGRVVEFFNRVDSNDPANSAIILIPLSVQGSEAEAQDHDTVAAVLAGTSDEQTGSTWVRKTLTDAELAAVAVDDANNRFPASLPQVSFGSPVAGNDTVGLLIAYDPDTTGGTDSSLVPLASHTFNVETDGNEVVLNAGDSVRAS